MILSPEIRLHKAVSIGFDLGAKLYVNANAVAEPFRVTGSVTGIYDNGTPVPTDKYGLGTINREFNEFISAVTFMRNPLDITLFGAISLDINLYKGAFWLQARAGYEYGITNSYTASSSAVFMSDGIYPIIYSAQLDRDVALRPLADCVTFKRQGLWVGAGFIFKL